MKTFMVIAKFMNGVTPEQIRDLIPAEQLQAEILKNKGLIGEIKVAMLKRTVFLEANAESEVEAEASIRTLPLAKLWDIEIFETTPPAGAAAVIQ